MMDILPVFIGYDAREQEAYDVAQFSLARHSSIPLHIQPLDLDALRRAGLYRRAPMPGSWTDRDDGKSFSTDFSFSRFLVPALCQWRGHALFVDCDMLFTRDVAELLNVADMNKAVSVVKHDFKPEVGLKMDARPQEPYPRKNWSSVMLFNCGHKANEKLTVDNVNLKSGSWLHGFRWLYDEEIGELPATWNWLEGHDPKPPDGLPANIHHTRGGPCLGWNHVDYADEWLSEQSLMNG